MSLHTAGKLLNFNPHLHVIFLNGVVLDDGSIEELGKLDKDDLELLFSEKLLDYLKEKGLIDDAVIENMSSWEHTGFSVWVGEGKSVAENREDVLFLARYLKKCPIVLDNIEVEEGEEVKVLYSAKFDDVLETKEFSPLDFLAELSQHIPDKWEQTTRYYGVYSARSRGKVNELEEEPGLEEEDAAVIAGDMDRTAPSSYWASCIKKVFEIDPLVCPKCGGDMKIIAFIHDRKEIKRISENLGECDWRAPPPFSKSANSDTDIFYNA